MRFVCDGVEKNCYAGLESITGNFFSGGHYRKHGTIENGFNFTLEIAVITQNEGLGNKNVYKSGRLRERFEIFKKINRVKIGGNFIP